MKRRTPRGRQGRPGSDLSWVKSSLSFANGNCVEVASLPNGEIGVRDSKNSEGPVPRFTSDVWRAFLGGVRNGEFDSFGHIWPLRKRRRSDFNIKLSGKANLDSFQSIKFDYRLKWQNCIRPYESAISRCYTSLSTLHSAMRAERTAAPGASRWVPSSTTDPVVCR
jgi:hypothetical protein